MSGLSLSISLMVILLSVTSAAAVEKNLTSRERERPVGTDARQKKTHSLTVGARCGEGVEDQQAKATDAMLVWERTVDEQQAGPSDDAATARFTFNNRSDQPIVILSVQSSCGGTGLPQIAGRIGCGLAILPGMLIHNEQTEADRPLARLALEDGSVFRGKAFGDTRPRSVDGEVCFNTSMSGYQEIITDPSYAGQIVTMTYPLIGNYGVNPGDLESNGPSIRGFVVRELANVSSNYRATHTLEKWLCEQEITGITGIDTRALTRKLRIDGAMRGVLSTHTDCGAGAVSDAQLVASAREAAGMVGQNLAREVSRDEAEVWSEDLGEWQPVQGEIEAAGAGRRFKVVAIDCGAKHNILRNLVDCECDVTVLPFDAAADDILSYKPDGLFISNGPGDPSAVGETVATLKTLHGKLPIFGICLGHQLLALSLGATTYKLHFGHRGGNQPVQNLETQKVEITSQNHGFAVDIESLKKVGGEPTHINLNDGSLEGFRHGTMPIFAVQYHPEASPGPHDARYLFDCFRSMMASGNSPTAADMDDSQRSRNAVVAV